MIDRKYLKLNSSIQTASNANGLLYDEEGNVEAKIELSLPQNIFESNQAEKIDQVEMLPTKLRLSMENTPIAAIPQDIEASQRLDAIVSSCKLGVYPYNLSNGNLLLPNPESEISLPLYKAHNMCVQIWLVTNPSSTGNGLIGAFYFNPFGEKYFPENDTDSDKLYEQIKTTNIWAELLQPMNIFVPEHHEKLELSRDGKIYIKQMGTLEEMFQNALENAITYASSGIDTVSEHITCPNNHPLVKTTIGHLRDGGLLPPAPTVYTCPLCYQYCGSEEEGGDDQIMYYCPTCTGDNKYIICETCYKEQPALLMRILVVPKTANRAIWANVEPAVQWDKIITSKYGGEYCLWKIINYTEKQPASTKITKTIQNAVKPDVHFGDQSMTISYDTAAFSKFIPVLGNTSFVDMFDRPGQLTLNTLFKNIWQAPPPKRVYRYGVNDDVTSYSFSLLRDYKIAVMSIIGDKIMKDTFSFLPWIKIDREIIMKMAKEYQRTPYQIVYENRTEHRTKVGKTYIMRTYPEGNILDPNSYVYGVYQASLPFDSEENAFYLSYTYQALEDGSQKINQSINYGTQPLWQVYYYNTSPLSASSHFPIDYLDKDIVYQNPENTITDGETTINVMDTEVTYEPQTPGETQITDVVNWTEKEYHDEIDYVNKFSSFAELLGLRFKSHPEIKTFINYQTGTTTGVPSMHGPIDSGEDGYFEFTFIPSFPPDKTEKVLSEDTTLGGDPLWNFTETWYITPPDSSQFAILTVNAFSLISSYSSDGYKFVVENEVETSEEERTNGFRVITELDVETTKYREKYIPNLSENSLDSFYLLDSTTCDVSIGPQEVIYGPRDFKYDVVDKVYQMKQTGFNTYYYIGNPDGTTLIDGGKVLCWPFAAHGTYSKNDHPLDVTEWPNMIYCREPQFIKWEDAFYPNIAVEIDRLVRVGYHSKYAYLIKPGCLVLEQRIGGVYRFDMRDDAPEQKYQHPLWEDLNAIFDGEDEDTNGKYVFYTRFYPGNLTSLMGSTETTVDPFPITPDEPIAPIGGVWRNDTSGYKFISENTYSTNDDSFSPGESEIIEPGPSTSTITSSFKADMSVYYRTNVQRVLNEHGNYDYIGPWVIGHRYYWRNGDESGYVWGPSQPYTGRRFVWDAEKKYTSRITWWKISAEQSDNEELSYIDEIPVIFQYVSQRSLHLNYNFERTITKTIREVREAPNELTGNVRLSFTWDNLPMVVMSPIQSIVLTMTGIRVVQEYQPINMTEIGGSSLTATIPIIENYSSLAQTLRDLHDELVVAKDGFNDNAKYLLSDTSGYERSIFFTANYITKDGTLHKIYIPPNGVFTLQLTFGLSIYNTA